VCLGLDRVNGGTVIKDKNWGIGFLSCGRGLTPIRTDDTDLRTGKNNNKGRSVSGWLTKTNQRIENGKGKDKGEMRGALHCVAR
jgi:hypothetical protein